MVTMAADRKAVRILDHKDRLGGLLILAFSIAYLRHALTLPGNPLGDETFTAGTLPVGLAVAAILLCLLQLLLSFRAAPDARVSDAVRGYRWKPPLLLIVAMSAYAWLFTVLGFLLASFLFLVAGFLILGERRLTVAASVAAGLVGFLWMLLTGVFGIHLDPGEIARLLRAPGS